MQRRAGTLRGILRNSYRRPASGLLMLLRDCRSTCCPPDHRRSRRARESDSARTLVRRRDLRFLSPRDQVRSDDLALITAGAGLTRRSPSTTCCANADAAVLLSDGTSRPANRARLSYSVAMSASRYDNLLWSSGRPLSGAGWIRPDWVRWGIGSSQSFGRIRSKAGCDRRRSSRRPADQTRVASSPPSCAYDVRGRGAADAWY